LGWRRATTQLRALVGPEYGRTYDHQVVEMVREVNGDGRWHIPAATYQAKDPLRATTLDASDRDVFIFLVDERNPITVQVGGEVRALFRGFMVWNSEVGHHRLGILTFLYDYVCYNRMVHGGRGRSRSLPSATPRERRNALPGTPAPFFEPIPKHRSPKSRPSSPWRQEPRCSATCQTRAKATPSLTTW
jgi:hypothetical protein